MFTYWLWNTPKDWVMNIIKIIAIYIIGTLVVGIAIALLESMGDYFGWSFFNCKFYKQFYGLFDYVTTPAMFVLTWLRDALFDVVGALLGWMWHMVMSVLV